MGAGILCRLEATHYGQGIYLYGRWNSCPIVSFISGTGIRFLLVVDRQTGSEVGNRKCVHSINGPYAKVADTV